MLLPLLWGPYSVANMPGSSSVVLGAGRERAALQSRTAFDVHDLLVKNHGSRQTTQMSMLSVFLSTV